MKYDNIPVLKRFYENRTSYYLAPLIKKISTAIVRNLNALNVKAYAIGDDWYYQGRPSMRDKKCLFVLVDPKGHYSTKLQKYTGVRSGYTTFERALINLKKSKWVVDDYPFGELTSVIEHHVIVIEFPEKLHERYDHFIEKRYSKIYKNRLDITSTGIPEKLPNGQPNTIFQILVKDPDYLPVYKSLMAHRLEIPEDKVIVNDDTEFDAPFLVKYMEYLREKI